MGDDSGERQKTASNQLFLQGFEWNVPADKKHWKRLTKALPAFRDIGITSVWVPPACKASSPEGNGYDIYDLYDLGEFDQKGSRETKWGSKEDLQELCWKAGEHGIGIYWDAVLNHKAGADDKETCKVVEVAMDNRNQQIGEPFDIDAWLGFSFPGRGDKYSAQKYHWYHFTGTDYDAKTEKKGVFKICGENKDWSRSVDKEQGNADYMMFADVDYHHQDCIDDVKNWGVWITKELGLKGFRLDAVQHYSERFTSEWIDNLRKECGDIFVVGEYWVGQAQTLCDWLELMHHMFSLFDAPLLYNFSRISTQEKGDLRSVFDGSLVKVKPVNAVTVVMNHDTQPGQTVATPIEGFFKPLAYSLILFRESGYPSIFYGDLYGIEGEHAEPPSCGNKLADLILARQLYAYGMQEDYFEQANCIGWVRRGTWDRPFGLAVVMSNAEQNELRMCVGSEHKGEVWTDVLGWSTQEVQIDEEGWGVFATPACSVAVYVNKKADSRDKFPVNFDSDIYEKGK